MAEDRTDPSDRSGESADAREGEALLKNLRAATKDLGLNPQEQALYAHHLDELHSGKGYDHGDGSISTLYPQTHERDGDTYLVPGVKNGMLLTKAEIADALEERGFDAYPRYASPRAAMERVNLMHEYMDRDLAESDHPGIHERFRAHAQPALGEPLEPTKTPGLINQ